MVFTKFALPCVALALESSNGDGLEGVAMMQSTRHVAYSVGAAAESVAKYQRTSLGGFEPPLGGIMPGATRPHLIMGVDVDYPPYAYLPDQADVKSPSDIDSVAGVGADLINAMGAYCGFDVTVVQAHWKDCWGAGEIGKGLLEGWYHGCMTYTHATGVRNRYLEFSGAWAIPNKPSGLIVKLTNGQSSISASDDLSGKTIVDVTGWAPTADTVKFVTNKCTGQPFGDVNIIQGDDVDLDEPDLCKGPNDRALKAVLEGKADAMWIYGDQAANYHCEAGEVQEGWNCDLWNGFGTEFAYLHSGMFKWMYNGTTISISRKGSGVAKIIDDCFDTFQQSREFYEVCKKDHHAHNQLKSCLPNSHFTADPDYKPHEVGSSPYMFDGNHHSDCSTGYCPC